MFSFHMCFSHILALGEVHIPEITAISFTLHLICFCGSFYPPTVAQQLKLVDYFIIER